MILCFLDKLLNVLIMQIFIVIESLCVEFNIESLVHIKRNILVQPLSKLATTSELTTLF